MSLLLNWHGAVAALVYADGRPRAFSVWGLTTEVRTIRGVAAALFGWLP